MTSPTPFDLGPAHIVGIGGIGMSGIADVMITMGYQVQGSDIRESDNIQRLRERGAKIFIGHAAENVEGAGTVIPLDQQRVQNALNSVIFRPDEGLVLDRLPAQDVCATVRYWPVRNPDRTATIDWCFRVDG